MRKKVKSIRPPSHEFSFAYLSPARSGFESLTEADAWRLFVDEAIHAKRPAELFRNGRLVARLAPLVDHHSNGVLS